jgi:hypothetical protein
MYWLNLVQNLRRDKILQGAVEEMVKIGYASDLSMKFSIHWLFIYFIICLIASEIIRKGNQVH